MGSSWISKLLTFVQFSVIAVMTLRSVELRVLPAMHSAAVTLCQRHELLLKCLCRWRIQDYRRAKGPHGAEKL